MAPAGPSRGAVVGDVVEPSLRLVDLPVELVHLEIARFFDLPTLVAFSMTSKFFRQKFWPHKMGEFDNYEFVMECVRRGYLDLLKWCESVGCYVDEDCLREAMVSKNFHIVRYLLAKFPAFVSTIRRNPELRNFYLYQSCMSDDPLLLDKFYTTDNECAYNVSIFYALFGRYSPALKYFQEVGTWRDPHSLVYYAAVGGHLKLAKKFWEKFPDPSADLNAILLRGACFGGHRSLIEAALNGGAKLTPTHLLSRDIVTNFSLFTFLLDKIDLARVEAVEREKFFAKLSSLICNYPNPETLRWLLGQGYELTMADITSLLQPTPTDNVWVKFDQTPLCNLSFLPIRGKLDRFASAKLLYSKDRFWRPQDLVLVRRWTNDLEELKWLSQVSKPAASLTDLFHHSGVEVLWKDFLPRFYRFSEVTPIFELNLFLTPDQLVRVISHCNDRLGLLYYLRDKFGVDLLKKTLNGDRLYAAILEALKAPQHPNFYPIRHSSVTITIEEPRGSAESERYRSMNLVEALRFLHFEVGLTISSELKAKFSKALRSKKAQKAFTLMFL